MTDQTPTDQAAADETMALFEVGTDEAATATANGSDAEGTALASPATLASSSASLARPRTRWAAIVWGLVLLAAAGMGAWFASGESRIDDLGAWLMEVEVGALIAYGLLALGAVVLITGLVGLLRKAQIAAARVRERA